MYMLCFGAWVCLLISHFSVLDFSGFIFMWLSYASRFIPWLVGVNRASFLTSTRSVQYFATNPIAYFLALGPRAGIQTFSGVLVSYFLGGGIFAIVAFSQFVFQCFYNALYPDACRLPEVDRHVSPLPGIVLLLVLSNMFLGTIVGLISFSGIGLWLFGMTYYHGARAGAGGESAFTGFIRFAHNRFAHSVEKIFLVTAVAQANVVAPEAPPCGGGRAGERSRDHEHIGTSASVSGFVDVPLDGAPPPVLTPSPAPRARRSLRTMNAPAVLQRELDERGEIPEQMRAPLNAALDQPAATVYDWTIISMISAFAAGFVFTFGRYVYDRILRKFFVQKQAKGKLVKESKSFTFWSNLGTFVMLAAGASSIMGVPALIKSFDVIFEGLRHLYCLYLIHTIEEGQAEAYAAQTYIFEDAPRDAYGERGIGFDNPRLVTLPAVYFSSPPVDGERVGTPGGRPSYRAVHPRVIVGLFHDATTRDVFTANYRDQDPEADFERIMHNDYFLLADYFNHGGANPARFLFGDERELIRNWKLNTPYGDDLRTALAGRSSILRGVLVWNLGYQRMRTVATNLRDLLMANLVLLAFCLGGLLPLAIFVAYKLYFKFFLMPRHIKYVPKPVVDDKGQRHLFKFVFHGDAKDYRTFMSEVVKEAKGKNKTGRGARSHALRILNPQHVAQQKFKFIYDLENSNWVQVDEDFDISGVAGVVSQAEYFRYLETHADALGLTDEIYAAVLERDFDKFIDLALTSGYYDEIDVEDYDERDEYYWAGGEYDSAPPTPSFSRPATPVNDDFFDSEPESHRAKSKVTFVNTEISKPTVPKPEALIREPSISTSFSKGVLPIKNEEGECLISASGDFIFFTTHVGPYVQKSYPAEFALAAVIAAYPHQDEELYIAPKPKVSGFRSAGSLAVAKAGPANCLRLENFPNNLSSGRIYVGRGNYLVHDNHTAVGDCNTPIIQNGSIVGWHFATYANENLFFPVTDDLLRRRDNYAAQVFHKSPVSGTGVTQPESKTTSPLIPKVESPSSVPAQSISVLRYSNGVPYVMVKDKKTGKEFPMTHFPSLDPKTVELLTQDDLSALAKYVKSDRTPKKLRVRISAFPALIRHLASLKKSSPDQKGSNSSP
jgi:hypothetical protein